MKTNCFNFGILFTKNKNENIFLKYIDMRTKKEYTLKQEE